MSETKRTREGYANLEIGGDYFLSPRSFCCELLYLRHIQVGLYQSGFSSNASMSRAARSCLRLALIIGYGENRTIERDVETKIPKASRALSRSWAGTSSASMIFTGSI
jgi:hypothetical protein